MIRRIQGVGTLYNLISVNVNACLVDFFSVVILLKHTHTHIYTHSFCFVQKLKALFAVVFIYKTATRMRVTKRRVLILTQPPFFIFIHSRSRPRYNTLFLITSRPTSTRIRSIRILVDDVFMSSRQRLQRTSHFINANTFYFYLSDKV